MNNQVEQIIIQQAELIEQVKYLNRYLEGKKPWQSIKPIKPEIDLEEDNLEVLAVQCSQEIAIRVAKVAKLMGEIKWLEEKVIKSEC